jgi:uncharacterized membrane protein
VLTGTEPRRGSARKDDILEATFTAVTVCYAGGVCTEALSDGGAAGDGGGGGSGGGSLIGGGGSAGGGGGGGVVLVVVLVALQLQMLKNRCRVQMECSASGAAATEIEDGGASKAEAVLGSKAGGSDSGAV